MPRRRFVASSLATAAVIASPLLAASTSADTAPGNEPATSLSPYLLFDGTCAEAMQFYHSALGGELEISKVKDSVMKNSMPATAQEKVLNARLRSDRIDFSASDWLRPDRARVRGNTVCLYLRCSTSQQLKSIFDKLSVGADVNDPLKAQPFGTYGALNDKFGVRWMFWTSEKNV